MSARPAWIARVAHCPFAALLFVAAVLLAPLGASAQPKGSAPPPTSTGGGRPGATGQAARPGAFTPPRPTTPSAAPASRNGAIPPATRSAPVTPTPRAATTAPAPRSTTNPPGSASRGGTSTRTPTRPASPFTRGAPTGASRTVTGNTITARPSSKPPQPTNTTAASVAARTSGSRTSSPVTDRRDTKKIDPAAQLHDSAVAGKLPRNVAQPQLLQLQARALDRIRQLFHNTYGDDGPLLDAVGSKLGAYGEALKHTDRSVGANRPVSQQQRDALRILLHTFRGKDAADTGLRKAVLDKLGGMGERGDIPVLLSHVQRAPTSTDLHHALSAIKSIMGRHGSPQGRGGQHLPADVRQLLDKKVLTQGEQNRVIEAVLKNGEIAKVKQHQGANRNEVYFVTFKETLPGPNGERVAIKAVFKPENTYVGKEKAFFSREVSAYEFDRDFTKTGRVPITVTALLSHNQSPSDGPRPHGAGSMQQMVPNAKPLGLSAVKLDPEFKKFLATPDGQKQLAEIKTLLFLLNDPDKLPDPGGFSTPNWGNIMAQSRADGGYRLVMIDNGGGQQALGKAVTKQMVPEKIPDGLARNLDSTDKGQVAQRLAPLVGDEAAGDVAGRIGAVQHR